MKTKKIVLSALFLGLGIIIPMITAHGFGLPGTAFLPMHFSVLIGGFVLGPLYGAIIGLLTPLLSMILTGMPNTMMLPIMMCELTLYGFSTGFLLQKCRLNIYVALICSMIIGRIGYALALFVAINLFGMVQFTKIAGVFAAASTGIFGIILQIALVPAVITVLEKVKNRG